MTDFDRIAASSPLNAQAGASASKGTDYSFSTSRMTFDVCPPLADDVAILCMKASAPDMVDYTGKKLGRLTVVGLMKKPKDVAKGWPARWVCRCVCGSLVGIKTAHLKAGMDRCDACVQTALMRGEKIAGKGLFYREESIKWVKA